MSAMSRSSGLVGALVVAQLGGEQLPAFLVELVLLASEELVEKGRQARAFEPPDIGFLFVENGAELGEPLFLGGQALPGLDDGPLELLLRPEPLRGLEEADFKVLGHDRSLLLIIPLFR
jgi:hypothetical protein